jgi:hypothetical protein
MASSMNQTRAALILLSCLLTVGCTASIRPYSVESPLLVSLVDVDAWDRLLGAHVRDGQVDYAALCDSEELDGMLDQIARVSLDGASRDEQLSFLINAYNARSISAILAGQRPSSLLGRYEFFIRHRHPVAGQQITLFDLEREVIKGFDEPRAHFAVVCSSASCPKLDSAAARPGGLDAWLDAATRRFVNDPTRNRFDLGAEVAELSAVFDWYRQEFEGVAGTLEEFVARYVEDPAVANALREGELKIRFLDYDWGLNGTPPGGKDGACPGR